MEDLSTVFNALKDFISQILAIFDINTAEAEDASSKASGVFEEAKKLFEQLKNLFSK